MNERFQQVDTGATLCYETFGDRTNPPIVLVMGLATQMIGWHEEFCQGLADRGFYVVRFDNRDSGRSTHAPTPAPSTRDILRRRFDPDQYTLSDMAADTAGLIRALDLAPAHVVGASMGGMIAQQLAAEHPATVRSLTSIMSSTGSRRHGQPAPGVYKYFLRRPPHDRESFVERAAEVFGVVGSTGFEHDHEWIRDRAERSFDRGHDVSAGARQLAAIIASGDRTKALAAIDAPTLVIHGSEDRMISPSGGRATAEAIHGAGLLIVDGMGHDLPRGAWPRLLDAIAGHALGADAEIESRDRTTLAR